MNTIHPSLSRKYRRMRQCGIAWGSLAAACAGLQMHAARFAVAPVGMVGGGGSSAGPRFTVAGALGQSFAVAESAHSARFSARFGFWSQAFDWPGSDPGLVRLDFSGGLPAQVELRFDGPAGRSYRVETAPEISGPWTEATTFAPSPTGAYAVSLSPATAAQFFRVVTD